MKAKHWYDYLWVYAIIYFALGFFNILFAWLGMIDFLLPLLLALFGGNKFFCNHLCGRGQLFSKLGTDLKCSRCKPTPRWMSSKWFRYGFLLFFLTMFGNMVFQTYLVAAGSDRYGALQAPHMVCVLSDGNHDAGYLQAEKQRINKDNRKEPYSWLN